MADYTNKLHFPNFETLMTKELSDKFMTEIIKSLNEITFNGERKIIAVRKYGNAVAVTVEEDNYFPKEAYNFSLATKQAEVVINEAKPKRIFFVDEIRKMLNQFLAEEISMSKFVEILNEKATGLSAIELHKSEKDSRCKKHGVIFDYINGHPICPICER